MKKSIRKYLLKIANGKEREEFDVLKANYDALLDSNNALKASHDKYVAHVEKGHDLDHRKDGEGVANLIREILFDTVQGEIGDSLKPRGSASRADVMETDVAVGKFAESVAGEIRTFVLGIKERNAVRVKWGKHVKCGVNVMMAMARGKGLLASFARIWAKEHKDERQKDVLTPGQIREWKSLDRKVQPAVNVAVTHGMNFWA